MRQQTGRITSALVSLLLAAPYAFTQESPGSRRAPAEEGVSLSAASDWALESVKLKSGTVYQGLVQAEGPTVIQFMEVVRPPGKPMFLVVRPILRRDVADMSRLPDEERQQLIERTGRFRQRALIEADHIDQVELEPLAEGGVWRHRYRGQWFKALSAADEETTRRCIVRIEQIFRAYRLILPPRASPRRPLEVLLFGSMDEYGDYLRSHGLPLENPSFFLARQNRIVAASELTRFSQHLANARARHAEIAKMCAALDADLPQRLQRLREQLKLRGYTKDEIGNEQEAWRNAWSQRRKKLLAQIEELNRKNDRRFAELTQQMFRRIYHEALHAYLENYVFPHEEFDLPRWLNEGLAQTFESGQLDGDTLRIDAPDRTALLAVQQQIASIDAPSIENMLSADETDFLTAHDESSGPGRQMYYLSWAVTYYLTFLSDRPVWSTAALDTYVKPDHRGLSPIMRFERLVGRSLPEFKRRWLNAIQELKPAPR